MAEAIEMEAEPAGSDVSTAGALQEPDGTVVGDIEVVGRREEVAPPTPPPPPPPPADPPRWSFGSWATTGAARVIHQLPVPSLGPVGRRRHPAAVMALTIVSLGGYAVVWHRRVNREMADFDARLEVRPFASGVAVFLAWSTALICSLTGAAMVVGHYLHFGPQIPLLAGAALGAGLLAGPYLTLLLPPSLVATVMTLERLRLVQERVGLRADRQIHPVRRLGVLLVPIFGGLWHLAAVQAHLNRVWRDSTPIPPPVSKSS